MVSLDALNPGFHAEFLILAAVSIAVIHSFAPDHYLPIVTIARTKDWGAGRAVLLSGIAATIHVTTSVILSISVLKGIDLAGYAELLEEVSPLMLMGFGMFYALISILRPHRHIHTLSTTTLLLVIGLSPCVPLIPIVLAAPTLHQAMFVALFFSLATVLTIVILTYVSYKALRPPRIGDGDVVAGLIVAAIGLITYILEGRAWIFRRIPEILKLRIPAEVNTQRMKSLA